jgi:hypothetical protein
MKHIKNIIYVGIYVKDHIYANIYDRCVYVSYKYAYMNMWQHICYLYDWKHFIYATTYVSCM